MTGFTDWSNVEGNDGDYGPTPEYEDFKGQGDYRIRLVGKPYMFDQLFLTPQETGEKAIPVIGDGKPDPMTSIGKEYKKRCAANIFLKEDGKSIHKVMRCGTMVFSTIAQWAQASGENPGGSNGCDFIVKVTGSGLNKKYSVTALTQTKFSKEEKDIIRIKEGPGGLWDLATCIQTTSHEQMKNMIEKYNLGVVSDSNASMDDPSSSADDYVEPDLDEDDDDDIPF